VHVHAGDVVQAPEGGELDALVVDVGAGAAAVGRHQGGGAGAGHREGDARLHEWHRRDRGDECEADTHHFLSPKSRLSTTSHRQWMARRCISCTRMVRGWATLRWKSAGRSIFAIAPPSRPVRAITTSPFAWAARIASTTFFELPEVEIARRTSPGTPSASTCLEKTWS